MHISHRADWVIQPMNPPEPRQEPHRSHLFTVRIWKEAMGDAMGDDTYEVRMQVKRVLSGQIRYFRTWAALIAYLQNVIQEDGS